MGEFNEAGKQAAATKETERNRQLEKLLTGELDGPKLHRSLVQQAYEEVCSTLTSEKAKYDVHITTWQKYPPLPFKFSVSGSALTCSLGVSVDEGQQGRAVVIAKRLEENGKTLVEQPEIVGLTSDVLAELMKKMLRELH